MPSFTTSATKGTLVKTLSSNSVDEQVYFKNSNNVFKGTLSGVSILNYERIENTGTGSPVIASNSTITLSASESVIISNSPFRLASFTTSQRNNLFAIDGDLILNTTTNKVQARVNGSWVDLH
tara:strand:+ start:37883 stop:38251 length:369 start_codon:yes stop_codon:yes gene_type:complete